MCECVSLCWCESSPPWPGSGLFKLYFVLVLCVLCWFVCFSQPLAVTPGASPLLPEDADNRGVFRWFRLVMFVDV